MAGLRVDQRQRFREIGEHEAHLLGVGAAGEGVELCAAHLARSDELHRPGDFGRALDTADAPADRAELTGHGLPPLLATPQNKEQGTGNRGGLSVCSLFRSPSILVPAQ